MLSPVKVLLGIFILSLSSVLVRSDDTNLTSTTLSLTKLVNITSGHGLVQSSQARAKHFSKGLQQLSDNEKPPPSVPIDNNVVIYLATVKVGLENPPYQLIIDTGSSNTWVGASQPYKPSSPDIGYFSVGYGSGFVFGLEYFDYVALAPALAVEQQLIGAAEFAIGFDGVDGILGIGPVDLTVGTVSSVGLAPTVPDTLLNEGVIKKEILGVTFHPASEYYSEGKLTFGGVDDGECTGPITYTPKLSNTTVAGQYWGINQTIRYGEHYLVKNVSTAAGNFTLQKEISGIVDTGTTLTLLGTGMFDQYISYTGGKYDPYVGLYTINATQYDELQPLVFNIGGTDFHFTPNAQIWPRELNVDIGGDPNAIYLVIQDLGEFLGLDFINGYTFLERFYSVFDSTPGYNRVGFATTAYTYSDAN